MTGYNDAFIIDGKERERLIKEDPKSAEVIRPILRGRDIKKYEYTFSDLWLINVHNGVKIKGIPPVDVNDYPAIKRHLDKYFPMLSNRTDKGDTPYNLRNCVYMDDFSKPKLIWKRIGSKLRFSYDETGCYVLDSTCFATGSMIKYLTAVLNSELGHYMLQDSPKTGTGDLIISVQAIEPLRVPIPSNDIQFKIERLVDDILQGDITEDFSMIKKEIDRIVFELYDINQEEIDYIESII